MNQSGNKGDHFSMTLLMALVIPMFMSLIGSAQSPSLSDDFTIEAVVQSEGKSKNQLFEAARIWTLRSLKTPDNLIELDDKDSNQIIATGMLPMDSRFWMACAVDNVLLNFKLTIQFKDGRFKWTADNMMYLYSLYCASASTPHRDPLNDLIFGKKLKIKIYEETEEKLAALLATLESATNNEQTDDDDW